MIRPQQGLALVEFAVIGTVALLLMFGCLEVGRMFFVWNTVVEATRVGARVAVVSASETAAKNAAVAVADAAQLKGLTTGNVTVTYYTETGGTATGPADPTVAFVSVSIAGYSHEVLIPMLPLPAVPVPAFKTTLPTESLGDAPAS